MSRVKTETREAAEALMFRCRRCGDSVCDPVVREFVWAEARKDTDEDTWALPSDDQVNNLNEVCKRCSKGLFSIAERECPACGSREIEPLLIMIAERDFPPTANTVFPYRCMACGKALFSFKEL